jgi:membrane protein YdbS with pleckstrin-like domain
VATWVLLALLILLLLLLVVLLVVLVKYKRGRYDMDREGTVKYVAK